MTATRRLALAALAALPLALAACDNKCPTTNPKIDAGGVPTCTGAAAVQAGAAVTVKLHVCPRCDQAADSCNVTLPAPGDSPIIQLDPLVQTCNPDSSCPVDPTSCQFVNCTFTAPAAGVYDLLVVNGTTNQPITPYPQLEVVAGSTPDNVCGG